MGDYRLSDVSTGVEHQLLEYLSVFALLDGVDLGSDKFDAVLVQDSLLVEGHGSIERRLPTESRQDCVWLFLDDNRLDDFWRDGLHVGSVGEVWVGHDGGWV